MKFEIVEHPPIINPTTLIHEFSYRIKLKPAIIRVGPTNFTGDFDLEKITEEDFEEIVKQLRVKVFKNHGEL